MSEESKAAGLIPAADHVARKVVRRPDGGFELRAGETSHLVVAASGGWVVEADDELDGGSLIRAGSEPGFVLKGKDGNAEIARTMPPVGINRESGLRFLLLEDGRLFRIVLRGPRDGRYELTGWETTGAYLTARPEAEGWSLEPTSACGGLDQIGLLCVMLAAEVLDAENNLWTAQP